MYQKHIKEEIMNTEIMPMYVKKNNNNNLYVTRTYKVINVSKLDSCNKCVKFI